MKKVSIRPSATPLFKWGAKKTGFYKGLKMKTDENVHEQIMDLLNSSSVELKNKKVLDWGCGTGALSARLNDFGADVLSVDQDGESFQATTAFRKIDFNNREEYLGFIKEFEGVFDVVIASEVIEHVENPWEFLRSIRRLVKDDGVAMISTPNTGSILSRLRFLISGNIFQFEESDLAYGHITPISFLKMNHIAKDVGLKITHWGEGGQLPVVWLSLSLKYWVYSFFSLITRPIVSGTKSGWCLMFVMRKKNLAELE